MITKGNKHPNVIPVTALTNVGSSIAPSASLIVLPIPAPSRTLNFLLCKKSKNKENYCQKRRYDRF